VSEDAGIEPRTVALLALAVRPINALIARSRPILPRSVSHFYTENPRGRSILFSVVFTPATSAVIGATLLGYQSCPCPACHLSKLTYTGACLPIHIIREVLWELKRKREYYNSLMRITVALARLFCLSSKFRFARTRKYIVST
jgi:hypothetical protein